MGRLTVRNLDDAVVAALKARAARNGRSAEAEHRLILQETLLRNDAPLERFSAAARLRARLERATEGGPDSTALIRADRDRDHLGAPDERAGERGSALLAQAALAPAPVPARGLLARLLGR